MNSCSSSGAELRRARPLLGTLVEMAVPAEAGGIAALDRAFGAIARVHGFMNAHDPASDLAAIAAARPGARIAVHPWTWRVLAAARRFAAASAGAFDPVAVVSAGRADWRDLEPGGDRRSVRCRRRLRLDLGGIAKGFAVDQAVGVLRRAGCPWGLVNAGGDLRVFGSRAWPVHLRRAEAPGLFLPVPAITDGAVATSAPYYSEHAANGRRRSALVDPRTGRFATGAVSVTVLAPTALAADALTKVVLFAPPAQTEALLRRFRARAIVQSAGTETRLAI